LFKRVLNVVVVVSFEKVAAVGNVVMVGKVVVG
jgi:hypothetical protein